MICNNIPYLKSIPHPPCRFTSKKSNPLTCPTRKSHPPQSTHYPIISYHFYISTLPHCLITSFSNYLFSALLYYLIFKLPHFQINPHYSFIALLQIQPIFKLSHFQIVIFSHFQIKQKLLVFRFKINLLLTIKQSYSFIIYQLAFAMRSLLLGIKFVQSLELWAS